MNEQSRTTMETKTKLDMQFIETMICLTYWICIYNIDLLKSWWVFWHFSCQLSFPGNPCFGVRMSTFIILLLVVYDLVAQYLQTIHLFQSIESPGINDTDLILMQFSVRGKKRNAGVTLKEILEKGWKQGTKVNTQNSAGRCLPSFGLDT